MEVLTPNCRALTKQEIDQSNPLYPERFRTLLKNKAPQTLHFRGNLKLLKLDGIGFSGSRKSSPRGIQIAADCAEQAAEKGLTIISGNAAGVDFTVHYHTLKANGNTILVLPEGIKHFRVKRAFEPVWDWDRVLVISQFNPNEIWQSYRAMERNKLIIALSKAMIVIEAGEKGGTMNAGLQTLKNNTPLYVAEYKDMSVDAKGNQELLNLGAKRLASSRETLRANMQNIFEDAAKEPTAIPHNNPMNL